MQDHDIKSLSPSSSASTVTPRTLWSPKSSITPQTPPTPYSVKRVMMDRGYVPCESIADTLQGSIWKVRSIKSRSSSVIKVAKKSLHRKKMAIINGQKLMVQEDIIKETAILRYLTSNKPPSSLAKFESFFSDKTNFFLVMENGGNEFFEFVSKCHEFINSGQLSIAEWHRFCKIAFKQMIDLVEWMHKKMNCCHLDISLENFVIDDVMVLVDPRTNHITFTGECVIKMVDFGLAEVFTAKNNAGDVDFRCTKYVGKTPYKAPKVYKRTVFDARAADVWSLSVVLFTMLVGGSPCKKPSKSDVHFRYLISGNVKKLVDLWDRSQYVSAAAVDLMQRIFVKQKYRINIDEIKKHPWLL